jgi:prolipoprotein diacylglyceryltransferase
LTVSAAVFVNRHFDRLLRRDIRVGRWTRPAFQICGLVGLALASLLSMTLVFAQGGSPWVMAAILVTSVLTFLGFAVATKIITGDERLAYYHHLVAVLTTSTVLIWTLGRDILPYLDATILGVGMFMVCGRVGCLMAGCCYGKPARWGVRYTAAHAVGTFPRRLVDIRLLPVQVFESTWVLVIVTVGSALVIADKAPGAALAWYLVAYNLGPFALEFLRGDAARPYHAGFSSPQWQALILTAAVIAGEWIGLLPERQWHLLALAIMIAAMIVVTVHRERQSKPQPVYP